MELHHLRCALAVADHRSFSRAADALHLSQPTLSYAIGRLETEVGARLFERLPRRIELTAAGEAFLVPARMAVGAADQATSAVMAITGLVAGHLNLAGIRTAISPMAELVSQYRQHYPGVLITIHDTGGDDDIVDIIRTGRCELGLMRQSAVPTDLPSTPIAAEAVVALFPTHLAPRDKTTITVAELAAYELIAPPLGTSVRTSHDRLFARAAVTPKIILECASQETLVQLVQQGIGVAVTASPSPSAAHNRLIAVPISAQASSVLVLAQRGTQLSAAADAFVQLAVSTGQRRRSRKRTARTHP
jgi:DNA-binding transcriptional LysR family regulator